MIANEGGVFQVLLKARDEASDTIKGFAESAKASLTDASNVSADATKKAVSSVEKLAKETSRASEKTADELKKAATEGAEAAEGAGIAWGTVRNVLAATAVSAIALGGAMLKSGLDNAENVGKLSKELGFTAETVSGLQFVAEQADVSFGSLGNSLSKLLKGIDTGARNEKAPINAVLAEMGLQASELMKLEPDQIILRVADAMDKIDNPVQKAAAAQSLFGKAGTEMIGVLQGGSQALREQMDDAKAWGAIVTTKAADAADKFGDQIDRIRTGMAGMSITLTNELATPLSSMITVLVDGVQKTGALEAAARSLLLILRLLGSGAVVVGAVFGTLGKILGGVAAATVSLLSGNFKEAVRSLGLIKDDLDEIGKSSKQMLEQLWSIDEAQKGTAGKGKLKKMSFGGGDDGYGMMRTNSVGDWTGAGSYSDVLPGAELLTRAREEAKAQEIEELDAHHEEVEERTQRHVIRLTNFDRSARAVRFQVGQHYDKLSLEASAMFFSQLGGLMQTKSRALFEIGKAGAIAETIIQTYRAAQGAYAALASIPVVGPGLGAAAAAAAIAVGFARVQAIRSTSYGSASGSPVLSGGGFTGPVVASGADVATPVPVASGQGVAAPRAREVNIYLSGEGSPTQSYIRDVLVPAINDALGDGATLNVRRV